MGGGTEPPKKTKGFFFTYMHVTPALDVGALNHSGLNSQELTRSSSGAT